jgi:hypothetical protein
MNQSEMVKLGTALAVCFAAYKFAPHPAVKGAALAVAAVAVARKVPVLSAALN